MAEFEELRELAADVRAFIDGATDKAGALRHVIASYDVVLGIYPSRGDMGIHVIKGAPFLEKMANSQADALYTHTAIALPDLHHAEKLRQLLEPISMASAEIPPPSTRRSRPAAKVGMWVPVLQRLRGDGLLGLVKRAISFRRLTFPSFSRSKVIKYVSDVAPLLIRGSNAPRSGHVSGQVMRRR